MPSCLDPVGQGFTAGLSRQRGIHPALPWFRHPNRTGNVSVIVCCFELSTCIAASSTGTEVPWLPPRRHW
jgi:hypothetical protein